MLKYKDNIYTDALFLKYLRGEHPQKALDIIWELLQSNQMEKKTFEYLFINLFKQR